jgi:hypothetical protein
MFDIYFGIAAQSRLFLQIHSLVLYQEMHYPLPEADTFDIESRYSGIRI